MLLFLLQSQFPISEITIYTFSSQIFPISSSQVTSNFPRKIEDITYKCPHLSTTRPSNPHPAALVTIFFLFVTMEEVLRASPFFAVDPIPSCLFKDFPQAFPFLSSVSSVSVFNGSFSSDCRYAPVSPILTTCFLAHVLSIYEPCLSSPS